ncbi:hypothetical protein [Flavisolibacter tropicus]|uniref:YD repeat-containing protein n=1 Tax=Flavisolibacter tropicus TaxID=1492898 RepID=A0A172TW45_9BACT|nr:hypothetical protein [Flavisolibacter tropicus]ANE51309.1 hypothetical protein SY85_13095 [Flavisolibacter tropicus]
MKTLLTAIFLPLICLTVNSCSGQENHKHIGLNVYYTLIDSIENPTAKAYKISVEHYNTDSNLIYQEVYASPAEYPQEKWGLLLSTTQLFYEDKRLVKEETQDRGAFQQTPTEKSVRTYSYNGERLQETAVNGNPHERYEYNREGRLTVLTLLYTGRKDFEHYSYTKGGQKDSVRQYLNNQLIAINTFRYDPSQRLIGRINFNQHGDTVFHEVLVRDADGNITERKWKGQGSRGGTNASNYFWYWEKYFYNDKGQKIKMEYYDLGRLAGRYEYRWE